VLLKWFYLTVFSIVQRGVGGALGF